MNAFTGGNEVISKTNTFLIFVTVLSAIATFAISAFTPLY